MVKLKSKSFLAAMGFAVLASLSAALTGAAVAQNGNAPAAAPGNKGMNTDQPTSDQAGQNMSDRDIMQKIRQAIMADNSLSTSAKNIKIISKDGMVTLRGRVRSDDEKRNIEAKATSVVGPNKVINELSVQP